MATLHLETAPQEQRSRNWTKTYSAFVQGLETNFEDLAFPFEAAVRHDLLAHSLAALYLNRAGLMSSGQTAQILILAQHTSEINESSLPSKRRRRHANQLMDNLSDAIGNYRYA